MLVTTIASDRPPGRSRPGGSLRFTRSAVTSIGRPSSFTFAAASGSFSKPINRVSSALITKPRAVVSSRVCLVSTFVAYSVPPFR